MSGNHLLHFCLLMGVLACDADSQIPDDKIRSIGNYVSADFTWARNIPNLTFAIDRNCSNFSDSFGCGVTWIFQAKSVEVFYYPLGIEPCEVYYNDYVHDAALRGYCIPRNNYDAEFRLELLYRLTDGGDLSAKYASTSTTVDSIKIFIKNCRQLSPQANSFVRISNTSDAGFEDPAIYSCNVTNNSALVLPGEPIQSIPGYQRNCQFDAKWNGTDDIQCYHAPTPELKINNSNKVDYVEDETLSLACDSSKTGNPAVDHSIYFLQNTIPDGSVLKEEVGNSLVTNYTMQNATIFCQAINDYVSHFNNDSGFSEPKILNISFGPVATNVDDSASKNPEQGLSYPLKFHFAANPNVPHSSLQLNFTSETDERNLNISEDSLTSSQQYQTYTHVISSVNQSDYGLYILTVTSTDPRFKKPLYMQVTLRDPKTTTTTSVSTSTTGGPPTAVIVGASVSGVVIVILIIVFVVLLMRRRKAKPDDPAKEERINPIYGSAPGPASTESYSTREEKDNPIYKSSDGGGIAIEEAYAEVNTKKKKKKGNGNDNTAFDPEVIEVTYAAVNKPKKNEKPAEEPQEAVYSAVNKKKKKKDPQGESGLHGLPTTGP